MAITTRPSREAAALKGLDRLLDACTPVQETLQEIVRHVVSVVESEVFFISTVDPHTALCTGAAIHNLDERVHQPAWEHEFLVPDYNKFASLTDRDPVGDLREATGGELSHSPRYRLLHDLADLEDELRAVLAAGGRPWGDLSIHRHRGDRPFTRADRDFLAAAAPLAGAALRARTLAGPTSDSPVRGPGVVVLDEAGAVTDTTADADAWLGELTGDDGPSTYVGLTAEQLLLPFAGARGPYAHDGWTRLRTLDGVWLTAHAAPLGGRGQIAVVIEPAGVGEIASIIVDAHGLTVREVEVTQAVARGLGTDEIAASLFLSPHTVRDHLKSVFAKVGVSSRGELTSRLFAELPRPPAHGSDLSRAEREPLKRGIAGTNSGG